MTKRLVQLASLLMISFLLVGCPDKEAAAPVDDPETFFQNPLPLGKPVYQEIVEPFFGQTEEDEADSLSLISYDPSVAVTVDYSADETLSRDEEGNPQFAFNSDSGEIVALDLEPGSDNVAELSVLVNDDSIYTVDHRDNQLRLLVHFSNEVCEIIPAETVVSTENAGLTTHTVQHAEWVYVMTTEESSDANDCASPNAAKRFYQLALNYQFNAVESEICVANGGTSTAADCRTNELPVVTESLARAQLVFGWHENELKVGYLGYGKSEALLRFFDENRNEVWAQPRTLQSFAVLNQGDYYSPETLFYLKELESYQYLLQLGRDVFVFDAGEELFDKDFSELDTILDDRSYHLETLMDENFNEEIVQAVKFYFDEDDLVLIDQGKVFRYHYIDAPLVTPNYQAVRLPEVSLNSRVAESAHPFSQFDLRDCADAADSVACNAAHDVQSDSWQFFTDCTFALDCSFETPVGEDCDTPDEILANPTLDNPCDPGNYLHLTELDQSANNAEFRSYMPFVEDYVRTLEYVMDENVLYVTARMSEKDVLLRYFFNLDLTEPKANREQVIFGERLAHQGISAYLDSDNLFVTSLRETGSRSDQCYKNYQRVPCNPGELTEAGGFGECTGFDLSQKLCYDQFIEYESQALFCDAAQLLANSCTDDQLIPTNTLAVEGADEDAKWLPMISPDGTQTMHLLLAPELSTAFDGEGVLEDATLYQVDEATGATTASIGELTGLVESLSFGWWSNMDQGRLELLSEDVIQEGGASLSAARSEATIHFLNTQTTTPEAVRVAERALDRKDTAPD